MASLEPLRGLTALSWLSLYENRVTDVAPLAGLTALRVLDLRNNDVVGFAALAGLTGLEELHLGVERYVGEENFTPVMRQPPPGDTYRFAVPMLSADLAWLAELTGLTHLSVSSLYVGDAAFLEALTGLENLSLRNAGVTPSALARAAKLRELRYLDVSNNWLTELGALLAGPLRLAGLWAAWNCLELRVDAEGRVLEVPCALQHRVTGRGLADQAHRAGVPLSICGEVAGDPTLVGVLVGLGIDQLSLAPAAIARVRQQLRSLDLDEARQLAEACRRADTVDDVRSILGRTDLAAAECAPAVGRDQAVDPVCGMIVSTRDNPHLLRVGGVRHYFCSSRCMRRFLTSVRDGKAVVQAD